MADYYTALGLVGRQIDAALKDAAGSAYTVPDGASFLLQVHDPATSRLLHSLPAALADAGTVTVRYTQAAGDFGVPDTYPCRFACIVAGAPRDVFPLPGYFTVQVEP